MWVLMVDDTKTIKCSYFYFKAILIVSKLLSIVKEIFINVILNTCE